MSSINPLMRYHLFKSRCRLGSKVSLQCMGDNILRLNSVNEVIFNSGEKYFNVVIVRNLIRKS